MTAVILKSTLLLVAALLAAFALRRQSAGVTHAVWTGGLLGAMAIPAFSVWLPAWSVAWPAGLPRFALPAGVAGWAFPVWAAGTGIGLGVILWAAVRLGRLVLTAERLDDARWQAIAADVRDRIGIRRPVELLHHPGIRLLGTWGVLRPRVLVPSAGIDWSERRIRMVLAHEFAHIRRGDWPVQILADAARAIYWFNPLFWLAANRLRRQSEHASDDVVIAMGLSRTDYAGELLDMTRMLGGRGHAPVLAVTQSFLERRLRAVLDPRIKRVAATPWAVGVIVLVAVGMALPLATIDGSFSTAPPGAGEAEPVARIVPETREPAASATDAVPTPVGAAGMSSESPGAALESSPRIAETRAAHASLSSAPGAATADEPVSTVGVADRFVPGGPDPFMCPVTQSVVVAPPEDSPATIASFGTGPWFVNDDRTIWVWDQPYVAGRVHNTIWIRPEGQRLELEAERLGPPADESPSGLEADPACCFPLAYKAMGLGFPTPGCWRVTATAGDARLTFVTDVGPAR